MAKKGARSRLATNNARLMKLGGLLVISVALFIALRLVRAAATARPLHYAACAFATLTAGTCWAALKLHAAPTYISGALEDGGADLSVPGGFLSSLHDGLYVSCAALLAAALVHDAGLALLGAFPAYAAVKAWGLLVPMLGGGGGGGGGGGVGAGGAGPPPPAGSAEAKAAAAAAERRERKAARRAGGGGGRR